MDSPILPPSDFHPPRSSWHFSWKRLLALFRRDEAILETDMPRFTLYSTELIILLLVSYAGLSVYALRHPAAVKEVPIVGPAISNAITSLESKSSSADKNNDGVPDNQDTNGNGIVDSKEGGSGGSGGGSGGGGGGGGGGSESAVNLFGASIQEGLPLNNRLTAASNLHLKYFRPKSLNVKDWTGTCSDCEAFSDYKFVWNIRNRSGQEASTFPTDMQAYKDAIAEGIDKYHPEVIVIENEAKSPDKFTGTVDEYQQMLEAACSVAHSHGIKCATDGSVGSTSTYYTYYYFYYVQGDTSRAEAYRQTGFQDYQKGKSPQAIANTVSSFLPWIDAYKAAEPDYINFHFYSDYTQDPAANATGFTETAAAFAAAVGKPAICNETGIQGGDNPEMVTARMQAALDYGIDYLIWYSNDGGPNAPRALTNSDGSLRSTGEAWANFITTNF